MNKKIVIIIVSLIVASLVGIGVIVLVKNTNASKNNENQESKFETGKFSFIYNYNDISDEWWNSINSELKEFEYTNRKVFELRAEKSLGNVNGKLSVRPVDFKENLRIGYESVTKKEEYYSLELKNNTFLIPERIKVIDDNINNVSSELKFYVLGSDLFIYMVSLRVDYNPKNVVLDNNNWKIISNEVNGTITYDAYYPINTDYCLHLQFPNAISSQELKDMNEKSREYYKNQMPYNEDDLKELVNKTVEVFSLSKIEGTDINNQTTFNVNLNDIELDNNTKIIINNTKMKNWHSGAENVAAKTSEKNSVIDLYNSNNELVYITEYSQDKDIDSYLSYINISLKEYNYNGRNIYIAYYNNKANKDYIGKYDGIMFKIDNTWYRIKSSKLVEPSIDVDAWINNMCKGVVSFQ